MDKYEYQVCADQIKLLISERRYVEAMNIADTIDWRKVRSVSMLQTVSEVYKINKKYEEARDILLLAYDRYPNGRTIVYALCELAIKLNDVLQAKELYEEFVTLAPEDTSRYILLYKLYEALDVSLEERIEVLEEFKKRDYRERWAYELAYLYHKTGQETRCVEECDELILWFGDGRYVKKAMELKMQHTRLSKEQQNKYDGRQEPMNDNFMKLQQTPVQQIYDTDPQAGNPQQIPQPYNGQYGQGYMNMNTDPSKQVYMQQAQPEQMSLQQTPVQGQIPEGQGIMPGQDMQMTVAPASAPVQRTAQMLNTSEIDSIQVKPVNVGMYNTIDLQNALSANISEFFERENSAVPDNNVKLSADTAGFDQQLYENDTMGFTTGNGPVIPVSILTPAENEMDDVPGNTEDVQITTFMPINAELVAGGEEEKTAYEDRQDAEAEQEEQDTEEQYSNEQDQKEQYPEEQDVTEQDKEEQYPETADIKEDMSAYKEPADTEDDKSGDEEVQENIPAEEKKPEYELDEEDSRDQDLDDIYKDWEDKKKENEERRIQEAKEKSLIQTSDIMAQLKGVLPEIDDIARPTPPRVVTKNETGEMPEIEPVFKPYFSPAADSEIRPASVSISLPDTDDEESGEEKEPIDFAAVDAKENESVQEVTDEPEEEVTEEAFEAGETKVLEEEEPEEESEDTETESAEESEEDTEEDTEPESAEESEEDTEEDMESESEASEESDAAEDIAEETEEEPGEEAAEEESEAVEEAAKEAEEESAEQEEAAETPAVTKSDDGFPEIEISFDPEEDMNFGTGKEESFDPEKLEVSGSVTKGEFDYLNDHEVKSNDDLYFREIMNIEDSEEEAIGNGKAGIKEDKTDELTYTEDEEAARKAAFEVTSELPKYPYEGLDDYGEVEEIEVIEQPEGLDGIMKTNDIPIDAIAQANYEAGLEVEEEEEVPKKKAKKKHPSYMKNDREKVSKRDFDKEEQLVFGRFEGIQWLKAEIVNAIDNVSMEPSRGNVIVMGSEASGRRTIAIDIVKVMQKLDNEFKGKVAKISGEALNKKDIPLTIKKLRKGALIIENAGGLTPSSARIVAEALELETEPVLVVMEGEKEGIEKLLDSSKKIMNRVFNARIELQEYTTDDLVAYGKGYARELEYTIDEMGVLAFYRRIGDMQTLEHTVTLEEVREIIDNAIKHVDKKNMSHFMDVILAKRYDDEDYIILREKDFIA